MNRAVASLAYADQSADALRLAVIEDAFDAEQFQVLERGRFLAGTVEVEAGILGQSHFLAVRGPRVAFAEVVACTPVEATPAPRHFELRRLRRGEWAGAPGGLASYRFRVHRRRTPTARPLADRLEADARAAARGNGSGIGLARTFPAGPHGLEARTVVWTRPMPGGLLVHTLHAYPNEGTSIFTRSAIRLP